MTLYLGIDPGLSGALAFLDPVNNSLEVFDMPTHTVKSNGKNKRKIDLHGLAIIIRDRAFKVQVGVVEEVGAMPGQGVTSMFSFGFSAGCAQMAVAMAQVPLVLVTPRVWKSAMRLKSNKDESRRAASRLMPQHAHLWPLVKHDGRAEAALLAQYLYQVTPRMNFNKENIEGML